MGAILQWIFKNMVNDETWMKEFPDKWHALEISLILHDRGPNRVEILPEL